MWKATIALLMTALLLAPVAAGASTGPYLGTVEQDQTNTHTYDNNPTGGPCATVVQDYAVVLRHAPATDTLTLSVGDDAMESVAGQAVLTIERGICTEFDIQVHGTDVADTAVYEVHVCEGTPLYLPASLACALPSTQ